MVSLTGSLTTFHPWKEKETRVFPCQEAVCYVHLCHIAKSHPHDYAGQSW